MILPLLVFLSLERWLPVDAFPKDGSQEFLGLVLINVDVLGGSCLLELFPLAL